MENCDLETVNEPTDGRILDPDPGGRKNLDNDENDMEVGNGKRKEPDYESDVTKETRKPRIRKSSSATTEDEIIEVNAIDETSQESIPVNVLEPKINIKILSEITPPSYRRNY